MELPPILPKLTTEELADLARAKALLENPGFTARLAGALGKPIEQGFKLLPHGWQGVVNKAAKVSLTTALNTAVTTLGRKDPKPSSERLHKLLAGASGGVGGLFGLAALPIELPVSTTIMLRSIADIARSEGHDVRDSLVKLSCLEVFALGGKSSVDDAAEGAYWAVRAGLAKAVSEAATYLARKKTIEESAPALLRLVAAIASRFGVVVSEQAAAKAIPIVGAAGGATVNVLFMSHFQDMARGHFIVKRLEVKYGTDLVRETYESLLIPA